MRKACKMIASARPTGDVSSYKPTEVLVRGKDGSKKEAIRAIKMAHKLMKLGKDAPRLQGYWPVDEIADEMGTVQQFSQSISMIVGPYTIQGVYHEQTGYWVFKV